MGFLDNSSITIDAVLTKYGKEKLANGQSLGITQFGCGDDTIDYSLWNPGNTGGSDKYGQAIEDLPMLESPVMGGQAMRYVLGTGQENRLANPILLLDATEIRLVYQGEYEGIQTITPQTKNFNGKEKYTFTFSDTRGFNANPGGHSIDKAQLEAPLPGSERGEERMIVGPTDKLEIWPIVTAKTLVTNILVVGVDSKAKGVVRVTAIPKS